MIPVRIAGMLALMLVFVWFARGDNKDGQWHFYVTYHPILSRDGAEVSGLLMSRWAGNAWEYRKTTAEEQVDYNDLIGLPRNGNFTN